MTTYTGSQTVKGGYYFNTRQWKLEVVEGSNGRLPGDEHARFVRVPTPALLVTAPLMGLVFVIALPFIGLAVIAQQAVATGRGAAAAGRARVRRWATVPPR